MSSLGGFVQVFTLICFLLACGGWGVWIQGKNSPSKSIGLAIAFGLSLFIILGALQLLIKIPTQGFQLCFVLTGNLLLFTFLIMRRSEPAELKVTNHDRFLSGIFPQICFWGSLVLLFLMSFVDHRYSCYDDFLAYFYHAKKISWVSDFEDPFGFRRLASFGGQQYLQSLLFLSGNGFGFLSIDQGIGTCLSGLLCRDIMKNSKAGSLGIVVAISILWANFLRVNTAPQAMGLAFVLAVYFQLTRMREVRSGRSVLQLALLGAAFVSLRSNFILIWILILSVTAISWADLRKELGKSFFLSILLLLPGSLLLFQSSQTVFFPLWPGTYNTKLATFSYVPDPSVYWTVIEDFFKYGQYDLLLFVTAAVVWFRTELIGVGLFFATSFFLVLMSALTLNTLGGFTGVRYSEAFITGTLIFVLARLFVLREVTPKKKSLGLFLFLAVGLLAIDGAQNLWIHIASGRVQDTFKEEFWIEPLSNSERNVRKIEDFLQNKGRVLVAIEKPYLLNLEKFDVLSLDLPLQARPVELAQLDFARPEEAIRLLRQFGIRQLVFENPDPGACLYSRKFWERERGKKSPLHMNWVQLFEDWFFFLDTIRSRSVNVPGTDFYVFDVEGAPGGSS